MLEAHFGPSAWKSGFLACRARKAKAGRRSESLVVVQTISATQPVPCTPGVGGGLSLSLMSGR